MIESRALSHRCRTKKFTRTGSRICAIGPFRVSSGGDIRFPPGTRPTVKWSWPVRSRRPSNRPARTISSRMKTCLIPGFLRRCGRSRRSAGPISAKIWNAARFCLLNTEGADAVPNPFGGEAAALPLHDRWIVSRLNETARDVRAQIDGYEFHAVVQTLYHFFWDDFCDWYIELSKATVTAELASPERNVARARLISVLEQALRLLHPFMPYLTEELWLKLPVDHAQLLHSAYRQTEPTIMLAAFPAGNESLIDAEAESEMNAVIELISRVRNIRSQMNIKAGDRVPVLVGVAGAKLRRAFE